MITTRQYDEKQQTERWKIKLAKELNAALAHAESCRTTADVIDSLVERIAEFEEIQTVEQVKQR